MTSAGDSNADLAYTYDNLGRTSTVSNAGTTGVPTVVLTAAYNAASSRTQLKATIASMLDFQNDSTFDPGAPGQRRPHDPRTELRW